MEPLTLPEPAATTPARTHHILDRHATPHTPGGDDWKIGSGTILAARWGPPPERAHRPARAPEYRQRGRHRDRGGGSIRLPADTLVASLPESHAAFERDGINALVTARGRNHVRVRSEITAAVQTHRDCSVLDCETPPLETHRRTKGRSDELRAPGALDWHAPAQAASRAVAALPQPERQRPGAAIGQHSANEQDDRYR